MNSHSQTEQLQPQKDEKLPSNHKELRKENTRKEGKHKEADIMREQSACPLLQCDIPTHDR